MDGQEIDSHHKAFAIIPKVGGTLSIIGCILILRDVFLKIKEQKTIPLTTKMMTLITVANLFLGFWENFLSTWMVPRGLAFMASGNVTTCNLQAFISVFMYMIVETAYTMLSALYYITVARKDWTTQKTRSWTVLFTFLVLPIIIGLGTAVPLLVTQQYNYNGAYSCGIATYPLDCYHNDDIPCERAPHAMIIRGWIVRYVIACFAVIIIFLSMLICNVKKQNAELAKHSEYYLQSIRGEGKSSNPVVFQSLRYLIAFSIPNLAVIFWGVIDIGRIQVSDNNVWLVIEYLYVILWPLFGALNSLVYFRLRYLNEKESSPKATWASLVGKTLTIPPLIRRSTADETLPPGISSLIDEDDLYSPLFEDEIATGSISNYSL